MFCVLARLRALAFSFLLFLSLSNARENSLFTSSVTYCEPPETLLIQYFYIEYFPSNHSVFFNISASSVQGNVNVTANLLLNVYGLTPLNVTLDLCNILGGALCPLPQYNFQGSDSISLPESLGVADKVPEIAFRIPDLEGFAQLVFTEVGTRRIKACVQATLSNGWSTHQPAVEWATGGVALAALLSAIWQSVTPDAVMPFRFLDLLYLYQTIASTSFLSLNYPSTYRAFTLNFAWAVGLFSSPSVQTSINRMRHLTGGSLPDATSNSAVGLVNRKLSPYNVPNSRFLTHPSTYPETSVLGLVSTLAISNTSTTHPGFFTLVTGSAGQGEVQTVTSVSSNILQAGIPIYVNSIHIATANTFMTVFLCALIVAAVTFGVFTLGYATLFVLKHYRVLKPEHVLHRFCQYSWISAWCLRLGLVMLFPIVTFAFYQWTLKDSWLSIFLSVLAFLAIISLIAYASIRIIRLACAETVDALYTDTRHLAAFGPLHARYRPPRYYFFAPFLLGSLLKSLFIAFAKGNGEVQIIAMVIIEGAILVSHLLRPYKTKGGDIFSTFLAMIRLVCTGLLISFVERLEVMAIPRVAIGLVTAVIFSVTIIITFINLILHSGVERLWTSRRSPGISTSSSADESMLEKGKMSNTNSSEYIGRPLNPTPEQSTPIDPHFLQPYPVSPTETVEQPSVHSRDSGTITVGSLLPRRWSFSPLNSPTNSSQAHQSTSSHTTSRHSDLPQTPALRNP